MDRARMTELEKAATGMATGNHSRFLAEVLNVLSDPNLKDEAERPIQALRLLDALWKTPYANRAEPLLALNDVGIWLEERLLRKPPPPASALREDVGWLKRLSRYHDSLRDSWADTGPRGGAPRDVTKSFGKGLAEVERRRRHAADSVVKAESESEAKAAPPPPATGKESHTETAGVTFDRGSQTLQAVCADRRNAEVRGSEALALLASLPDELQQQIKRGRSVKLRVTWAPLGNGRRIVTVA